MRGKNGSGWEKTNPGVFMMTSKWFLSASALALSFGLSTHSFADVSIDDVLNDATTTNDVVVGTRHARTAL
jgi:hypothetical protein